MIGSDLATATLGQKHLFSNLVERANAQPDGVFCHIRRRGAYETVSNGQIVTEAVWFGNHLLAAGTRPGQIVPIILEHRRELYSCFIGCTLAGLVPTLLSPLTAKQDPSVAARSMRALLKRIDPICLICSTAARAIVEPSEQHIVNVDEVSAEIVTNELPSQPGTCDLAFLQHSSGTTGLKKGVALSHQAVIRQIATYADSIAAASSDVVVSWLPLYHDMGLITSFLLPAFTGIPIVSMDALEWTVRPAILLDAIQNYRATLCWLPNFAFHHIVRMAEPSRNWDLSSLRMLVSCSEPCRSAAFEAFSRRFSGSGLAAGTLQVCYAMAENVFAVTQTVRSQPVPTASNSRFQGFLSSGEVLNNATVRIMRDDGSEALPGEMGEIQLRSDCLFDGYFREPELSRERLRDGWYHSRDLGFFDGTQLFVVGRRDDMININGRKLIAHELEDDLNRIDGVIPGRVLVYSSYDEATGATRLAVAVERIGDETDQDARIASDIRRQIVNNCGLRPAKVTLLERGFLLKSTSGKISRQASVDKLTVRTDTEFRC